MTYKKICSIQNNQIILTLPPDFSNKKQVTVIVDDEIDVNIKKIELMKQAAEDPLFLEDMNEVNKDFSLIDHETL